MKKISNTTLFFLLLTLLLLPSLAVAQSETEEYYQRFIQPFTESAKQNSDYSIITVKEGTVIEDNFVRFANEITIDGDVHGDVIVGANTVTVNGEVNGDVIALANIIEINGPVAGNVRVAAGQVTLNNTVGKNVNIFAGQVTISEKALISWSLSFFAGDIDINSPIGGNIYGFGGNVTVNNTVGTNVTLILDETGQVTLKPKAVIGKDFTYRGEKNAVIESGALIKGDTIHKLVSANVLKARKLLSQAWIYSKIIGLFALLLVGTILISLFKKKTQEITQKMWDDPVPKILWGVLLLIATPIAAFLIALTIIGWPLTLMLMAIYIFLLYISKIFIGLLIGQKILVAKKDNKNKKEISLIWIMMLGVFIFFVLTNIPYIGWLFSLIGIIWFLGTVWQMILPKKSDKITDKQYAKNQSKNI